MYMKNRNALIVWISLLVVLFFAGQFFFTPKAWLVSRVGSALQAPVILVRSLVNRVTIARQISVLTLENQSLRAQLTELNERPQILKDGAVRYITASIFSRYPFNDTDNVLLNVGEREGIKQGMPVLAAPGVFLGRIESVTAKTAVVKTIFTSGWELPVRIGAERVEALFVSGREPKLTLISKKKNVSGGEEVFLSSRDFPLGLTLGTVGAVTEPSEDIFKEARLAGPYDITE